MAMRSPPLLVMVCLLAARCSPSGTTPGAGAGGSAGSAGPAGATGATGGAAGGRGGTTSASPGFGGTGGSGAAGATAGSGPAGSPDAAAATADATAADATAIEAAGPVDGGDDAAPVPSGGERSAGCAVMNGLPEGDSTLPVGGMTRSFRLRLPAGYPGGRAWPLVLALHPNGGSGIGYWDGSARNLREVVRDKAILVLPLARGGAGDWDWRGDLPADNAYFEALLTRLKDRLCVDTRRIFAMGFSGGGSYAGVLGCLRRDVRAIATGGAVIYFDRGACVGKPAAWVTIGQGELIAGREMFRDHFRAAAGCQSNSTATMPTGCVAYGGCANEAPVHFCTHPGGHEWPGFATQAAWDFFARF